MEAFDKIAACRFGSSADETVASVAGYIGGLANTGTVYFIGPKRSDGTGADEGPNDLECWVADHFHGHGHEAVHIHLLEEPAAIGVLRFARDRDVDLIIVGRPPADEPGASARIALVERLARKATCSVMAVPKGASAAFCRVLVPVRNSDCSANALETAARLANAAGASLTCLDVFQVHGGYQRIGSTYDEHIARLKAHAERECRRLIQRVETGGMQIDEVLVPDPQDKPAEVILEAARDRNVDLLVIGARGRTGAAGVLLGHVTEQLLRTSDVPVLAVKKKGECLGLLEALLTLGG